MCNPIELVSQIGRLSSFEHADKSNHQSPHPHRKSLGLVFQGFRRWALACFERPTLRGWHYRYLLMQR
ncbi:hypothetical protein GCWU000325_02272 [Alloprevotella tannerae ATCC 51259]|uniref:Uncharacterized protein n=1 Tax=Alloprevotella tannerae ATCC 51259 TaxID=626522 RepID=C9LJ60_9BACT|nr:hypothetical protein GCWU000325_02272 [Alloprevotella tannerae ATCC 51259]